MFKIKDIYYATVSRVDRINTKNGKRNARKAIRAVKKMARDKKNYNKVRNISIEPYEKNKVRWIKITGECDLKIYDGPGCNIVVGELLKKHGYFTDDGKEFSM